MRCRMKLRIRATRDSTPYKLLDKGLGVFIHPGAYIPPVLILPSKPTSILIPDFTTTDIFVTACASAAPLFLPGPLSSLSNCCLGPAALQSAWKNTLTAGKKFIHPVQTKPRKRKEIVSSNCFVTFPPSHSSHSHDLSQSCCLFWSKKSSYLFANFTRD